MPCMKIYHLILNFSVHLAFNGIAMMRISSLITFKFTNVRELSFGA
jgi:hypothetical protein